MRCWDRIVPGLAMAVAMTGCYSSHNFMDERALQFEAPQAKMHADGFAPGPAEMEISMVDVAAPDVAAPTLPVPEGRMMAYSVNLRFETHDAAKAIREAVEMARKAGGYILYVDDYTVRLRIPVATAEQCLTAMEALGKLTSKNIVGEDVTAQVIDVDVRLSNLRSLQENLQKLLERTGKISDLLEVEREMARITTEIERLEAMRKNLALQVAYYDVRIAFSINTPPVVAQRSSLSLPWVTALGSEVGASRLPMNDKYDMPFTFTLPDGFVGMFSANDTYYAMNAEDVVLKLSSRANRKDAGVRFWNELILRSLPQRGFLLTEGSGIDSSASGREFARVTTQRLQGNAAWGYWLLVFVEEGGWFSNGYVHTVECWGPEEAITALDWRPMADSVKL